MAYIQQVEESEAQDQLAGVYDAARRRTGGIANIIRVMSRDSNSLASSMQFYLSMMKSDNALDAARREMLAVVVSNVNDCYY